MGNGDERMHTKSTEKGLLEIQMGGGKWKTDEMGAAGSKLRKQRGKARNYANLSSSHLQF